MSLPSPIFSIDEALARQDRFTVKYGDAIYTGHIEWDGDYDGDGFVDCSSFNLYDQAGSEAPVEIATDDLVVDGFNEIKESIVDPYYRYAPLKPIVPRGCRA